MRSLLSFALHALATIILAWGWFSLPNSTWVQNLKGGYLLFLTNQGLAVAWLYMVVSLLYDVFPSIKIVPRVKRALLVVSMPLACVISIIYWSLILFRPHLIKQRELIRIPITTDLALHALPLFSILLDFFCFESKLSKAQVRRVAPLSIVAFSTWYACFIEYCATFNKIFPYPFLSYNPFPIRVVIYITAAGIALGCIRTLNALHS